MKAPVDYPLDASSLLKDLQGDELIQLSMLDRMVVNAQPIEVSSGPATPKAGLKRRRVKRRKISAKPAIVDAPMNINDTAQTTPHVENTTQQRVFLDIAQNETGAVEAH